MLDFSGNSLPSNGNVTYNTPSGWQTASSDDFMPYALRKAASGNNEDLYNMMLYSEYLTGQNNEYNSAEAEKNRAFQSSESSIARKFNAEQAQVNRDWQEMMSNTAHQREVNDLKAAGLNPVLSANGGQGAAVTAGSAAQTSAQGSAQASADTSAATAIAGLMASVLRDQTTLRAQELNAENNMAIAEKTNSLNYLLGTLQAGVQKYGYELGYAGTKYSADSHLAGVKYGADSSLAATKYASDISKVIAGMNNRTSRSIAIQNNQSAKDIAKMNNNNALKLQYKDFGYGIINTLLGSYLNAPKEFASIFSNLL